MREIAFAWFLKETADLSEYYRECADEPRVPNRNPVWDVYEKAIEIGLFDIIVTDARNHIEYHWRGHVSRHSK